MLRFFYHGATAPQGAKVSSLSRIHDHTQTRHRRWDSSGRGISPAQRLLPDNTQHLQHTNIHGSGGIRTRSLSKRGAADPRLRRRGHWDRPYVKVKSCKSPDKAVCLPSLFQVLSSTLYLLTLSSVSCLSNV